MSLQGVPGVELGQTPLHLEPVIRANSRPVPYGPGGLPLRLQRPSCAMGSIGDERILSGRRYHRHQRDRRTFAAPRLPRPRPQRTSA